MARDGALNMALDNLLAIHAGKPGSPVVLHLYRWNEPTLSCGFHQRIEERIDFESCQRYGVDVVRRPTGGRELLHDGDLSFSVSSHLEREAFGGYAKFHAGEIFFKACRVITRALEALGIKALIKSGRKKVENTTLIPCLASPSQYEILCDGKKVVPIAQRVYQHSVLAHGSIPLDDSMIPIARLLRVSDAERLQRQIDKSSVSLNRLLNADIDIEQLKKCLWQSFQEVYGGKTKDQPLSEDEITEAMTMAGRWECRILARLHSGQDIR